MNEDDDSAKKTTAEEEAPAQKLSHKVILRLRPLTGCWRYGEEAATFIVAAFVVFVDAAEKRCN